MAPREQDDLYLPPGPDDSYGEDPNQYRLPPPHGAPAAPYQVFVAQSPASTVPLPAVEPSPPVSADDTASLISAYICAVAPIGIFGAQYFYLRRYSRGFLYLFTFGLVGIGYISDWFRVSQLVKEYNERVLSGQRAPSSPRRNVFEAYQMWFPLGLFGFHHYYLRRWTWGIAYTFSIGFFGIGWLIDGCRMPSLVAKCNAKASVQEAITNALPFRRTRLSSAYVMSIPPLGLFGGHHYLMKNTKWGLLYTFTLGLLGCGWIADLFRMPVLVTRANTENKLRMESSRILPSKKHIDSAYVLWFPLGIFGFHHFYLGRHSWGVTYIFTLGCFGIGWLIDACRIPSFVEEANKKILNRTDLGHRVQITMGGVQQPAQVFIIAPNPQPQPQQQQEPWHPGLQQNPPPPMPSGDTFNQPQQQAPWHPGLQESLPPPPSGDAGMPPSYDSIVGPPAASASDVRACAMTPMEHQNEANERLDSLTCSKQSAASPLPPKETFPPLNP